MKNYDKDYMLKLLDNNNFALEETPRLYEEAKIFYRFKKLTNLAPKMSSL